MLALHGVTTDGLALAPLFAAWRGPDVHAVDLRGHGDSPADPPWTLEQHVDDVCAAIAALGGPVVLLGFSFGGLVALRTALAAPGLVAALVLLDPAAGVEAPPGDAPLAFAWESEPEARAAYRALLDERTAHAGMAWFDARRAVHGDGSVSLRCSAGAVAAALAAMAEPLPPLDRLAAPVLLVLAARGSLLGAAARAQLVAAGARLASVDSEHDLPWAAPAATRALVEAYVSAATGLRGSP